MPCGSGALVTAYVVYQSLSFVERVLLIEALRELGYSPTAADNVDDINSTPVHDDSGRVVAGAAIVIPVHRCVSRFPEALNLRWGQV